MEKEIKAGSVVKLKPGGPEMTVRFVTLKDISDSFDPRENRKEVSCCWFHEGRCVVDWFILDNLELVR